MPRPHIPLVRRTAMAQSSSCSQMEMKLDWRSIYSKLLRRKKVLVYPVSSSSESAGRRAGRQQQQKKKITWRLRRRMRHSCAQTRQLTIRAGRKEAEISVPSVSSPAWSHNKVSEFALKSGGRAAASSSSSSRGGGEKKTDILL